MRAFFLMLVVIMLLVLALGGLEAIASRGLLLRSEKSRKQLVVFGGLIREANAEPGRSRRRREAGLRGASHDFPLELEPSPIGQVHGQLE